MIRKDEKDALFRTAAAGAGKVVLSKLAWSVPILQPNDAVNLHKSHSRIVSCVNVKCSLYIHCMAVTVVILLTNTQVWLNHSRYPSLDMATDFTKEQYAGVYKSFYNFASRYYRIDNLLDGGAVSHAAFKFMYSKQND